MAISAHVVSGNILHELLESLLVARLLAPAQRSRHVDDGSHRPSLRCTLERECITAREATSFGTPKSKRRVVPRNDGPSGFAVVEVQIVRHKTMIGSYIRSKRQERQPRAKKTKAGRKWNERVERRRQIELPAINKHALKCRHYVRRLAGRGNP
jgi:hypothetical protein